MGAEAQIALLPWALKLLAWDTPKFERSSPQSQRLVLSCIETILGIWGDFHCSPTSLSSLEAHPKGEDFTPLLIHGLFLVAGDTLPLTPL